MFFIKKKIADLKKYMAEKVKTLKEFVVLLSCAEIFLNLDH